jgi:hypothetical protein
MFSDRTIARAPPGPPTWSGSGASGSTTSAWAPGSSVDRGPAEGRHRRAAGRDPVIQRGDVLHCDVGITALRLNTDTSTTRTSSSPARPTRPRACAQRSPTPTGSRISCSRRSAPA